MLGFLDIDGLKEWFYGQAKIYEGKPCLLQIQYQAAKQGKETPIGFMRNFDGDAVPAMDDPMYKNAVDTFTPDNAWNWLLLSLNTLIAAGVDVVMVSYHTAGKGSARASMQVTLKPKGGAFHNLNNISGFGQFQNYPGINMPYTNSPYGINGIGNIHTISLPQKTEEQIRAEVKKEFENEKRIEDLEETIEYLQQERLGSFAKVGQILEHNPSLAQGVGVVLGKIADNLGTIINNLVSPKVKTTSIGIIEDEYVENADFMNIDKSILENIKRHFPNEDPKVFLLKLLKWLEENQGMKSVIDLQISKIEL